MPVDPLLFPDRRPLAKVVDIATRSPVEERPLVSVAAALAAHVLTMSSRGSGGEVLFISPGRLLRAVEDGIAILDLDPYMPLPLEDAE